ncbi:MAG TPA: WG repeat-containing protein [Polyangia bacterium]|jgi:hypothetical protein
MLSESREDRFAAASPVRAVLLNTTVVLVASVALLGGCRAGSQPSSSRATAAGPSDARRADGPASGEQSPPALPASQGGWLFGVGSIYSCGFIDATGREVIPRSLRVENCFMSGFPRGGRFSVRSGGQSGYIDDRGRVAIPARYFSASAFHDGLALVQQDSRYGFIDPTGREVILLRYRAASDFSEGLAAVNADGSPAGWGYINTRGEQVIAAGYRKADAFANGLAVVETDSGPSVIDARGRAVLAPTALRGWNALDSFAEGYLSVLRAGDPPFVNRCAFIDRIGRLLRVGGEASACQAFSEGLAAVGLKVGRDLRYGFTDQTGRLVIAARFDNADRFAGGLAPVKIGGRWGFIDRQGHIVIQPRFLDAAPFSHSLAWVTTETGELGYVDGEGRLVWPRPMSPPVGRRRIPVRTLAQGSAAMGAGHRELRVIESRRDLEQLWDRLYRWYQPPRPVPATDFGRFDYLLAAQGERSDLAWGIRITEVVRADARALVRFDELEPVFARGALAIHPMSARPFHLVEVEKQHAAYVFEGRLLNSVPHGHR